MMEGTKSVFGSLTASRLATFALFVMLSSRPAVAQQTTWVYNYDETRVAPYTLPDLLTLQDGTPVRNAAMWRTQRRPEILSLFATQVYGRTPTSRLPVRFVVTSVDRHALQGSAIRKQITAYFTKSESGPRMHILLYLPTGTRKPPVFLGLNFGGNQSVHSDPGVDLPEIWGPDASIPNRGTAPAGVKKTAPTASRGSASALWQIEKILQRGYGLATIYYGDIEPDFVGGMQYGIRPLFFLKDQTEPPPDEWGAIGAWAWGLSRAVDYLKEDQEVDASKIALIGHSRLGKTALWAAAQDERIALVISNESGKGGASLSKRGFGEPVGHLAGAFPHWFCKNYAQYVNHEDQLPVDGHMLVALIAPRPIYIASAEDDRGSDPRGEFLSAVSASKVYELLGKKGLGTDEMPSVNQPIMQTIGYHVRTGKHSVTAYDWDQYLNFADMHFGRVPSPVH
ncbi:MAG: acetylxylan esterase [Terriglobales bacterium]